jgi:hypothetical protein
MKITFRKKTSFTCFAMPHKNINIIEIDFIGGIEYGR